MKIAMLEPIAVPRELLESLTAGLDVDLCLSPLSEEEKAQRARDAEVLIIANSPLSEGIISAASNLKMISVAFTGVDHVPKDACTARGITVCNAQGYATIAVRDLVFGFIFDLLRNLRACDKVVRECGTKDGLVGNEIDGKTIGIVGYGQIGQAVAHVAAALGCKILANSPSRPSGTTDGLADFVTLDELLANSDIVTLHTPLTPQTKGLIGAEQLKKMKPTAFLINAARGPVVDAAALRDALNGGTIAGAGIDVFDIEPPLKPDEPLFAAKNTVLAPHIGFATKESMVKRAVIVFENVRAFIEGKPINVKW